MPYLNTISLEDWAPKQPTERWCSVKVLERYDFDGVARVRVEILEGPEKGRVVSGIGPGNLRESRGDKPTLADKALTLWCGQCHVAPGNPCVGTGYALPKGSPCGRPHKKRMDAARRAAKEAT